MKKSIFSLAHLLLILLFLSGCGQVDEDDDSELPWVEPEGWEQQIGPFMTQ